MNKSEPSGFSHGVLELSVFEDVFLNETRIQEGSHLFRDMNKWVKFGKTATAGGHICLSPEEVVDQKDRCYRRLTSELFWVIGGRSKLKDEIINTVRLRDEVMLSERTRQRIHGVILKLFHDDIDPGSLKVSIGGGFGRYAFNREHYRRTIIETLKVTREALEGCFLESRISTLVLPFHPLNLESAVYIDTQRSAIRIGYADTQNQDLLDYDMSPLEVSLPDLQTRSMQEMLKHYFPRPETRSMKFLSPEEAEAFK